MPSRIDRYRMVDGKTPLGAGYFNPIWQDIDVRLLSVESMTITWEAAVRQVSDLGLARINEVLAPALAEVEALTDAAGQQFVDVEAARAIALANIAALEQAVADMAAAVAAATQDATSDINAFESAKIVEIATWQASRLAEIDAWKTARLAELEDWRAALEAALPQIVSRMDALEADAAMLVTLDDAVALAIALS